MKNCLHIAVFTMFLSLLQVGCATVSKLEKQMICDNDSIRTEAIYEFNQKLTSEKQFKIVRSLINRAKHGKPEESIQAFKVLADAQFPLDLSRPYVYWVRTEWTVKYERLVSEIRDVDSPSLNNYFYALSHGESKTRAWVAVVLGDVIPARISICNSLLQTLHDSDITVQEAAMFSLRRMRKIGHITIMPKLSDGDLRAAYILSGMEKYDPEVFRVSSSNINNKDENTRILAIQSLLMCPYEIDSTKVLLTKILMDSSKAVREATLITIRNDQYINEATLVLISKAAKEADTERSAWFEVLFRTLPKSQPYIVPFLSSPFREMKTRAINALCMAGDKANPFLVVALGGTDSIMQFNVACIILSGNANDERTKSLIRSMLHTKNSQKLRDYIADLRLYPHLIPLFSAEIMPLLSSDNEGIINEALETVYTMHHLKVQSYPRQWRDTQLYRDTLAEVKFKDDAFMASKSLLIDASVSIRAAVAGNMYRFDSRAVPVLCDLISKETHEKVLVLAYQSLAILRPTDSLTIHFLIGQLQQSNKHIDDISNVLAYIGKPAAPAVGTLIPFLEKGPPYAQSAVAKALERIGTKEAIRAVKKYDQEQRKEAELRDKQRRLRKTEK